MISDIYKQALTVQQTAPLTEMGTVQTAWSVWTRRRQRVGFTPRDSPQKCRRWTKTPRGRRKVIDVTLTIYKLKLVYILCLILSYSSLIIFNIYKDIFCFYHISYKHVSLFDYFTRTYLVPNNFYEFHHFE